MKTISTLKTAVFAATLVSAATHTAYAATTVGYGSSSINTEQENTSVVHHGKGKLNTFGSNRTVNMTHGPIEPLGMPGMRMDFKVSGDVDLSTFKEGDTVDFKLIEGSGGWYVIIKMTKIVAE